MVDLRRTRRARVGAFVALAAVIAAVGGAHTAASVSDPTATLVGLAQAPPPGLALTLSTAAVAAWTTAERRGLLSSPALRRAGAKVWRSAGLGTSPPKVALAATGGVERATVRTPRAWAEVALLPPTEARRGRPSLAVAAVAVGPAGTARTRLQVLARAVAAWGSPQVGVTLSGTARTTLPPRTVAAILLRSLGARYVEGVAGERAADVFGRLRGAPAVAVAGRRLNVEIAVARRAHGLLVEVGFPFVLPISGRSWA
ncbi:MAG: hypothetical protein K6V73_03435 [Firmicutes bacterium]|nr:hypothetical protein [Bacillota bacterium]